MDGNQKDQKQLDILTRPGSFKETIFIVTVSFPQNINDGNDNLYPQHFFLNVKCFWTIPNTERYIQ